MHRISLTLVVLVVALAAVAGATAGATGRGTLTYVQIFSQPASIQAAVGAKAAAAPLGFKVVVTGPTQLNPSEGVTDTQNALAAGTKAMLVTAFGPFDQVLNQAISRGVAVATIDVTAPKSRVPFHVGAPNANEAAALADLFAQKLGAGASGTIVTGTCVPGYAPLVAKINGFKREMKRKEPHVKVTGPFNVTGAPTTNFAAWQRLISQNQKALGFVGVCDPDVTSLVKVKRSQSGAKYLIGAVAGGDNSTTMPAIKSGVLTGAINQHSYVEGYVGARLLAEHIVSGKALPKGWINTGFDLVTSKNVRKIAKVVAATTAGHPAAAAAFYKPLIKKILANPQKAVVGPVAANNKLGPRKLSKSYG